MQMAPSQTTNERLRERELRRRNEEVNVRKEERELPAGRMSEDRAMLSDRQSGPILTEQAQRKKKEIRKACVVEQTSNGCEDEQSGSILYTRVALHGPLMASYIDPPTHLVRVDLPMHLTVKVVQSGTCFVVPVPGKQIMCPPASSVLVRKH